MHLWIFLSLMLSSPAFLWSPLRNNCDWSAFSLYSNSADVPSIFVVFECTIELCKEILCFPTLDWQCPDLWCHVKNMYNPLHDFITQSNSPKQIPAAFNPVKPDFRPWICSCNFIGFETWVKINLIFLHKETKEVLGLITDEWLKIKLWKGRRKLLDHAGKEVVFSSLEKCAWELQLVICINHVNLIDRYRVPSMG